MTMNIIGDEKQQEVIDLELASTSPNTEWERFALVNTNQLQIYVRNKYDTPDQQTFMITLSEEFVL
jgi:hypothetical protein